ncbi:MAG: two-component system, OmpR family, sensor kinase [Frankiaceae bacterium]|nr:two-component system, OmpR family, sensor kinase [Frankiaceae bacterium]
MAGTIADRAAPHPRHRLFRRPWSLRVRLLVSLIGLLAVVCLVVGVATELALRSFLLGRLDAQLAAAGGRSAMAVQEPPDGDRDSFRPGRREGDGAGFVVAPGQAAGTLGARIVNGTVTDAAVSTQVGRLQTIDPAAVATLTEVPLDGHPHSKDIVAVGDYRLQVLRAPDGDLLVTGLPLSGVRLTLLRLAAVEGLVAVVALISAGLVGAQIVRRTLRPLDRVAATAGRVATLELDRGEVALAERVDEADTDPRTEAGRVGSALNQLLNHVDAALTARQASETRVRQFVADASHELRTPLAAIRGYAELTRRSGAQASPDVLYSLGRVESEAKRMTTLVEDLLLLARLDTGRPLGHDPVDLVPLVVHAVSDAHAVGGDHRWHLDLPDEPVLVEGDEARLHQVVVNLLANARTHTPPRTDVTVAVRREGADHGGRAVLSVADTGPGIPPDLLPDVFQRFARGDGSRSRTAGSTGLGLAIVAAVVGAHGGEVSVASEPGDTVFVVSLPGLDVADDDTADDTADGAGNGAAARKHPLRASG